MNFKRFHESKNLFDLTAYYGVDSGISNINIDNGNITYNARNQYLAIKYKFSLTPTDVFTISLGSGSEKVQLELRYKKNGSIVGSMILITAGNHLVITGGDAYNEFTIFISNATNTGICKASNIMLNTGSQPLPYEPYSSEVWHDIPHYIHNTSTDTLTTLPADIYADGTNATVGISGNMSQTGTPTPDNPIMPQGTGERTGNLLDATMYDKSAISYAILSMPVTIPIVTLTSPEGLYTRVVWTKSTGAPERVHVSDWIAPENSSTFELALYSNADCFKIEFRNVAYSALTDEDIARRFNIMLNLGSTPLPYEPYGYKIPILSAGQTTPVYLGEVQTTRRIKKLVLTGEENITSSHLNVGVFNVPINDYLRAPILSSMCTHYKATQNILEWNRVPDKNTCFYVGIDEDFRQLYIRDSSYSTISDFKAYLAAQYAAGTPVCVWYVLATEETGIVNEPIRKIGEYADTVSGITIPTITGKDTFDVLTTLKPSEVELTYTGWHDATVEEWNGSQWQ